jgi:anti-sigma factor RsiW
VANLSKFDEMSGGKPAACEVCEAMLPDAVDGLLPADERRAFDAHVAGCVACAQELEGAQRGAAWLAMLKSQTPEVPAGLLTKILEGTTGAAAAESLAATAHVSEARHGAPGFVPAQTAPAWAISSLWRRAVGAFRVDGSRMTFQPRLAMTAAMAFFSIALTLNLTGVRLNNLHAADFTPSGLWHNASDMSASATRSFQNMRVVYQVESRVSELRGDERETLGSDREPASSPQPKPSAPVQKNEPKQDAPQQKTPQGHSDLTLPQPERVVRETAAPRKAA